MSGARPARLDQSDPRVGDTVDVEGREWEVSDHSSYWNAEGYRVNEWCCEVEDVTAYLLKEQETTGAPRWLFTRQIATEGVTLPDGGRLADGVRQGAAASPPGTLAYQGQTYRYGDTTEGTYEDEPGERVSKTTWDYWDAAHVKNLAVERWVDGRIDCYLGAYVEASKVTLRPGAGASEESPDPLPAQLASDARGTGVSGAKTTPRAAVNPFAAAVVALLVGYFLPFFVGQPFDRCMAVALPLAAVGGWLLALVRLPLASLGALALVPVLASLFWRFPALTTPTGVAALVAAPAAVVWLAWLRGVGAERRAVHYLAGFTVAAPLLALGLYHYFQFAPGPHTLGQWVLALGPAALGGLAALIVSWAGLAALATDTP